MKTRPERPEEHEEIGQLVRAAFGGRENEPMLVSGIRSTPGYRPELSLVIPWAGRLVGHLMLSEVDLVRPGHWQPVLALAPMSVLPDLSRQGYGSALIRAGLRRADEAGEALVVVLGDPDYYGRFGFVPAASMGIGSPDGVAAEYFGARALSAYNPEMTGTVEFPAVFAETGTLSLSWLRVGQRTTPSGARMLACPLTSRPPST